MRASLFYGSRGMRFRDEETVYAGDGIPRAVTRLEEIARQLAASKAVIGEPPRSARGAVAVILRGRAAVEVLVIERSEREGDPWSGQLAFPGGRRSRGDRTLLDTVRRETKEEVGLSLSRNARLLGWLPARAPGNRVEWVVVPFVFALTRAARLAPGPEVARALWVPLDEMPSSLHRAVIELPGGDLEVPAFLVGGMPLWGFSFRVLCDLFDLVGWPGETARRKPEPKARRITRSR